MLLAARRNKQLERDVATMVRVAEESTYHGPCIAILDLPDNEEWIVSGGGQPMDNEQQGAAMRSRAGYVPPWVKRLPLPVKALWCRWGGHPLGALETITWVIGGQRVPGHICLRCFARVDLSRLLPGPYLLVKDLPHPAGSEWICSGWVQGGDPPGLRTLDEPDTIDVVWDDD